MKTLPAVDPDYFVYIARIIHECCEGRLCVPPELPTSIRLQDATLSLSNSVLDRALCLASQELRSLAVLDIRPYLIRLTHLHQLFGCQQSHTLHEHALRMAAVTRFIDELGPDGFGGYDITD